MSTGAVIPHQYIDRRTGQVVNERLFGDRLVRWLYSDLRENASVLYRLTLNRHLSEALGILNYDLPMSGLIGGNNAFLKATGVDLGECLDNPKTFTSARKLFERKIRYWERRGAAREQ
jgi:phosphatidylserine decarboxylase